MQYKDVIFTTDLSGVRLPIGLAIKVKQLRSSNGVPDILIFEPNMFHHALFLEVKKESPFKKDGNLKSNEHLAEQLNIIELLRDKDYAAMFVWTFDDAKERIDNYMSLRDSEKNKGLF
jgi:hypothetical protein